jgi:hypothetical protein
MPKHVKINGVTLSFDDSASDDKIHEAVDEYLKNNQQPESTPAQNVQESVQAPTAEDVISNQKAALGKMFGGSIANNFQPAEAQPTTEQPFQLPASPMANILQNQIKQDKAAQVQQAANKDLAKTEFETNLVGDKDLYYANKNIANKLAANTATDEEKQVAEQLKPHIEAQQHDLDQKYLHWGLTNFSDNPQDIKVADLAQQYANAMQSADPKVKATAYDYLADIKKINPDWQPNLQALNPQAQAQLKNIYQDQVVEYQSAKREYERAKSQLGGTAAQLAANVPLSNIANLDAEKNFKDAEAKLRDASIALKAGYKAYVLKENVGGEQQLATQNPTNGITPTEISLNLLKGFGNFSATTLNTLASAIKGVSQQQNGEYSPTYQQQPIIQQAQALKDAYAAHGIEAPKDINEAAMPFASQAGKSAGEMGYMIAQTLPVAPLVELTAGGALGGDAAKIADDLIATKQFGNVVKGAAIKSAMGGTTFATATADPKQFTTGVELELAGTLGNFMPKMIADNPYLNKLAGAGATVTGLEAAHLANAAVRYTATSDDFKTALEKAGISPNLTDESKNLLINYILFAGGAALHGGKEPTMSMEEKSRLGEDLIKNGAKPEDVANLENSIATTQVEINPTAKTQIEQVAEQPIEEKPTPTEVPTEPKVNEPINIKPTINPEENSLGAIEENNNHIKQVEDGRYHDSNIKDQVAENIVRKGADAESLSPSENLANIREANDALEAATSVPKVESGNEPAQPETAGEQHTGSENKTSEPAAGEVQGKQPNAAETEIGTFKDVPSNQKQTALKDILDKAQIRNRLDVSHKNNSHYWVVDGEYYRVSDHTKPKGSFGEESYRGKQGETDFRSYDDFYNFLNDKLDLSDKSKAESNYKAQAERHIKKVGADYQQPDGSKFGSMDAALNNMWRLKKEIPKAVEQSQLNQNQNEKANEVREIESRQGQSENKRGQPIGEKERQEADAEKEKVGQGEATPQSSNYGTKGELKFSDNVSIPFSYKVIDASELQPSHLPSGERNPDHLIGLAQPKERNDEGSKLVQKKIADNPNLNEVGESPNAYFGAPVINERGEVIQGNNRSIGLKKHYEDNGTSYKKSLIENASKFGLDKSEIENIKNPILVREVKVGDNEAIKLGNSDVKDLETGGTQRIDALVTARKMESKDKAKLAALIFDGEYNSIKEAIRENSKKIASIIKDYINPAQFNSTFKKDGELTASGMDDIESVMHHFLYDKGDAILPEIFKRLPDNIQKGLQKALKHIVNTPEDHSLLPDAQKAIMALGEFKGSGIDSFNSWLKSKELFGKELPTERYTPIEIELAKQLNSATTQQEISKIFNKYAELVNGKAADMFEPEIKGLDKKSAIEKQFNVKYEKEDTKTNGNDLPRKVEENNPKPIVEPTTTKSETKTITTKPADNAIQIESPSGEVPPIGKAGENIPEGSSGMGQSKQGEEAAKPSEEKVISEQAQKLIDAKKMSLASYKAKYKDATDAEFLANRTRGLKISQDLGGNKLMFNPLGLPIHVWNTAIETVAKSIGAGEKISDAVKAALDYLKKTNPEITEQQVRQHLIDASLSIPQRISLGEKIDDIMAKSKDKVLAKYEKIIAENHPELSPEQVKYTAQTVLNNSIEKWKGLEAKETKQQAVKDKLKALTTNSASDNPKAYTGIIPAIRDFFTQNFAQLKNVSPESKDAAAKYFSSAAQAATIMRKAIGEINKKYGEKTWEELRMALVQSRLNGARERFKEIGNTITQIPDTDLAKELDGNIGDILDNIEARTPLENLKQDAIALITNGNYDAAKKLIKSSFDYAASSVADVDFTKGRSFDEIKNDPKVQSALGIYKNLVEKPIKENHASNDGIMSNALGDLDTYFPLINADSKGKMFAASSPKFKKVANLKNKMATGLGEAYDISVEKLKDDLTSAFKANNKTTFIKSLEDAGVVQNLAPNQQGAESIVINGQPYKATTITIGEPRTSSDGKTIAPQRVTMPTWLAKELSPMLDAKKMDKTEFGKVMDKITQFALGGIFEPAIHAANLIGAVTNGTPFAGTGILSKTIGNLPVTKVLTSLFNIVNEDVEGTDKTNVKVGDKELTPIEHIQNMASIGLINPRIGGVTWSKEFAKATGAEKVSPLNMSPLLYGKKGIDLKARVLMDRICLSINPDATPEQRRVFGNQLGNYVQGLESKLERSLKQNGISPFFTASSTFLKNGIKGWVGATPLPTEGLSFKQKATYRAAQMLSAGAVGLVGSWAVAYKAQTGKYPWEDDNSNFLKIPLTEEQKTYIDEHPLLKKFFYKNGKWQDVNWGFFNRTLERGAKGLGIDAAYNTAQQGGDIAQIAERMHTQQLNSFLTPLVGSPSIHAIMGAITGMSPYITSTRDYRTGNPSLDLVHTTKTMDNFLKQAGANVAQAAIDVNPLVSQASDVTGWNFKPNYNKDTEESQSALKMVMDIAMPNLMKPHIDNEAKREQLETEKYRIEKAAGVEDGE